MNMFRIFNKAKKEFGIVPLCNGKSNRALHINGFCFPLCWRCTSITLSAFICGILDLVHHIYYEKISTSLLIIISILLILPTLLDGILQYKFYMESTNVRRILTGIMCGIGFWFIANILSIFIQVIWNTKR